jgi:hypothetical protein
MRVCYLIQTHRDPRQIARLVKTLRRMSPSAVLLVAHDETGCALDGGALGAGSLEVRRIRVPGPIRRGYLSALDPYFQGIEWLRREKVEYDWLVYLSGQDYPVQPLAASEAMLAAADCDGFLRHWPALGSSGPWRRRRQGLFRYYFRYRDAPRGVVPLLRLLRTMNGVQSLVHVHLSYGPRVGVRVRRTPFTSGRICYAGWQWTTLRRACADYVWEAVLRERELVDHYRRTICPDESLVQTILVGSGRFRLADDNLRYADASGGKDGRPRLLGGADIDLVTSGAYHFARKFDLEHDARALDLLDERLSARGTALEDTPHPPQERPRT